MSLPSLPKPERPSRLLQRLLITKIGLYGFLLLVGVIFIFLNVFSDAGIWLPAFRLLMAALLVSVAFVENTLRCEDQTPVAGEATVVAEPSARKRLQLPPHLQAWLAHFHQHLATTTFVALLAVCFAGAGLCDTAPLSVADPIISRAIPGLLLVLGFGLLVMERILSFKLHPQWRNQLEYIGLARAMLSVLLLATLWLIKLANLLVLLIALEYLLRVLSAMIAPLPADNAPCFLTRSILAAQYRWPLRWMRLNSISASIFARCRRFA